MRRRSQELTKPIAGAASLSTPLTKNKPPLISPSFPGINLRKGQNRLRSHGSAMRYLYHEAKTQLLLYIEASGTDSQRSVAPDTTRKISNIV